MTRREALQTLGAAIAAAPIQPGQRKYRVRIQTHVDAIVTTREEAPEAAAVFLWDLLVGRFIDPQTSRANLPLLKATFIRTVEKWASVDPN